MNIAVADFAVEDIQVEAGPPARTVSWLGTQYTITIDRRDSAGVIGMFDATVPVDHGPPVHVHHKEDEVIHVLAGAYEFWLDGVTFREGPGSSVFLPRGVPHTFRVLGPAPGRNLAVLTPGGFEQFFVEVAARALRIPDDMAALTALGRRYGIEFRGAPQWPD